MQQTALEVRAHKIVQAFAALGRHQDTPRLEIEYVVPMAGLDVLVTEVLPRHGFTQPQVIQGKENRWIIQVDNPFALSAHQLKLAKWIDHLTVALALAEARDDLPVYILSFIEMSPAYIDEVASHFLAKGFVMDSSKLESNQVLLFVVMRGP